MTQAKSRVNKLFIERKYDLTQDLHDWSQCNSEAG